MTFGIARTTSNDPGSPVIPFCCSSAVDPRLAGIAERQHGVFALWQVRQIGFTPAAVQHRLRTGRWELLQPGVYRLPGSPRSWEQRLMAAVLAAGTEAVASHRSAAALLGIPGFRRPGRLELSTPRSRRARTPDATVHRTLHLPDAHVAVVNGIPTTRAARTLVDLAGVLPATQTERAVDNCLAMDVVTVRTLGELTNELAAGRPGIALLRRLLDERGDGYVAPASELEVRFLSLVRTAGLEEPVRQLDVGDDRGWAGRVDYAYPALRLLIELDSRRHHTAKLDFEADRARDNRRVAARWRPIRFTWEMVTTRPDDVEDVLRRAGVTSRRQDDVA